MSFLTSLIQWINAGEGPGKGAAEGLICCPLTTSPVATASTDRNWTSDWAHKGYFQVSLKSSHPFTPRQCIFSPSSLEHFPTQSSLFLPIVQWLFGCIWHASVVAFLHLLPYTFSQWNSHFLGLNSTKKWWGCCSVMAGFRPCVMGGPSLAADLLHICTGPHRRNKAINKRAIAGNICLPKHWLWVQEFIGLQGTHWSSNTLSGMSCEMQHLQADPWAGFRESACSFAHFPESHCIPHTAILAVAQILEI